ncbi:MAG: acetyl-CoA acetyltransferase [Actinobacteria bacterium]|nr:acetyl-CoA acetyltransferase [Actinomycetota bacterium]
MIVSVGQAVGRSDPASPITLMERAVRAALDEATGIEEKIGRVSVVNILNGGGRAPATLLAERLKLDPLRCETTTIGGNTPQWLVTRAAAGIADGQGTTTLIAGAEAVHSQRIKPELGNEADKTEAVDPIVGDDRPGLSPAELVAGMMVPAHVYPMFESVWVHRAGRSFAEHRAALGWLLARFTRRAAEHQFSWFRDELTADDISTPTADNRLVAEPYTKRRNAFISVDQAATVTVTSLEIAREIGAAGDVVFVHSGADANDVWFPVQRPDPGASPGIRAAGRAALSSAGIGVDDVTAFDLYSCFPCAVEMACEALGISEDDHRDLTVTGGLPYFGGPGNNYSTHGIASMVDELREQGGRGLVTALGWFATKHSIGIYGIAPPPHGFRVGDTSAAQREIDASTEPVAADVSGPVAATVVAGTVVYDRDGAVPSAPVIAALDDGRRVAAMADRAELGRLAGQNLVGSLVRVEGSPPRYRVEKGSV